MLQIEGGHQRVERGKGIRKKQRKTQKEPVNPTIKKNSNQQLREIKKKEQITVVKKGVAS